MCNKHILLSDTLHLLSVLVCARILSCKLNNLLSLTFLPYKSSPVVFFLYPKLQLLLKGKWFDNIMIKEKYRLHLQSSKHRTSIDASGKTELLASLYLVTRQVLWWRQCRATAECVKYEERNSVQEYFDCPSL